jgi:hypothetical protein
LILLSAAARRRFETPSPAKRVPVIGNIECGGSPPISISVARVPASSRSPHIHEASNLCGRVSAAPIERNFQSTADFVKFFESL